MASSGDKKESDKWDALKGLALLIVLIGVYWTACAPSAAQLEADRRATQEWEWEKAYGPPPGSWVPGSPNIINGRVIGPLGSDPPPGSWVPGSPDIINERVR
jgi:hypothetical protein